MLSKYSTKTVANVYLNPDKPHFILLKDIIEAQNHYIGDYVPHFESLYELNIM